MDFVTAPDGAALATHTLGTAGPVETILVPGGPCRGVEYLAELAGIAATRPIAVLHPRGTPTTGGLSRGWWTDADDVIALADARGAASVDLIAHSAGTRLALAVAARHPDRIRSLVLVTPPATWLTGAEHDGEAIARRRTDPAVHAALASLSAREPADEDEFQQAWALEAPAGYAHWTAVERRHATTGRMSLEAATAWFRDIPADAADRILAAPLPPTLVVGGSGDILTGDAPVRAYAAALGAELAMIDDCGHYPWIEQPDAFGTILDDWLTRVAVP